MDFSNKTAIITGGASGIGLLCGKCLAEAGANIILTDVNRDMLAQASKEITQMGGHATGIPCDVRNYLEIEAVCSEAVRLYGSIDILINCAGGASGRVFGCKKPYHDFPVEYIDWGIDVNLKGPMYFSHAAMKQMVQQKSGTIILLGSITGEEGSPNAVDYSAAKSALMNGFLKSLAQACSPYGIRVCTVSPGPVLTRPAMAHMQTLLRRAAQPQEIVDFILYLCSEKAAFITGANYMIDGGRSCMMDEV